MENKDICILLKQVGKLSQRKRKLAHCFRIHSVLKKAISKKDSEVLLTDLRFMNVKPCRFHYRSVVKVFEIRIQVLVDKYTPKLNIQ